MKNLMTVLGALCLVLGFAANVAVASVKIDDLYYNLNNATMTAEVVDDSSYMMNLKGDVEIPASVTDGGRSYAVTSIGRNAFGACFSLTSLTVNSAMEKDWESKKGDYGIDPHLETVKVNFVTTPTLTARQVVKAAWGGALMSGDLAISAADYDNACAYYDLTPKTEPKVVQEGEIAVKQTELRAAKAEAVTVANGVVTLGVTVNTNGNFTAETKDWKPVELTTDNVEVKDGRIVISIPVGGDSGFMILQSGDAKVGVKSDDAAPVALIIEARVEVENPDPEGGN